MIGFLADASGWCRSQPRTICGLPRRSPSSFRAAQPGLAQPASGPGNRQPEPHDVHPPILDQQPPGKRGPGWIRRGRQPDGRNVAGRGGHEPGGQSTPGTVIMPRETRMPCCGCSAGLCLWLAVIMIISLLVMAVAGRWIIGLLFGPAYVPLAGVALCLMLAAGLRNFSIFLGRAIASMRRFRTSLLLARRRHRGARAPAARLDRLARADGGRLGLDAELAGHGLAVVGRRIAGGAAVPVNSLESLEFPALRLPKSGRRQNRFRKSCSRSEIYTARGEK